MGIFTIGVFTHPIEIIKFASLIIVSIFADFSVFAIPFYKVSAQRNLLELFIIIVVAAASVVILVFMLVTGILTTIVVVLGLSIGLGVVHFKKIFQL